MFVHYVVYNHQNGCQCPPGYTGLSCSAPCPAGRYGRRCMGSCSCRNGGECYHVSGECRCPGGWTGPDCSQPCPPGRWGPGCSHACYCHNQATCNPVDGVCKCRPGFTGTTKLLTAVSKYLKLNIHRQTSLLDFSDLYNIGPYFSQVRFHFPGAV